MHRKIGLILTLLLAITGNVRGQTFPVNIETISIDEGLSDIYVYCIAQDQLGYIWFGTKNGLNRYDGKHVRAYYYSTTQGLQDSRINVLLCTTNGHLLVGTAQGIDMYDRRTDKIVPFKPARSVRHEVIRTHLQEGDILWVGTNHGLFSINLKNGESVCFSTDNSGLVNNIVRAIHIDGDNIFVGTFNGLSRYDRVSRQWRSINLKPESITNPKNNLILSIVEAPEDPDKLLIGMQTGLCELDKETLSYKIYNKSSHHEIRNNTIKCMSVVNNSVWIGTEDGLMILKDGHFTNYFYLPNNKKSLPNNIIGAIFRDNRGILWIGTEGGVAKYDMGAPAFHWVDLSNSKGNKYSNVSLFTAQIDRSGTFWFGSRLGLCQYDPKSDIVKWIDFRDDVLGTYNFIRGLYLDKNDILWVGTAEGLVCYDTQTGRKIYINDFLDNRLKYIIGVCAKDDNSILVCDVTGRVQSVSFTFNPIDRNITVTSEELIAFGKDASSIIFHQGYIWVGTVGGGLMRYRMENGEMDTFIPSDSSRHISSNFVTCLFVDHKETLWYCGDKGIAQYDPASDSFLPTPNILKNPEYVYAANSDSSGNIWFIARQNIIYYDVSTGECSRFPTGNWIDVNNSIPSCIVADHQGNVYITALDGYLKLNAHDIAEKYPSAPLLLSDIRIAGTSILESGLNHGIPVEDLSEFKLNYTQNVVSFYFSLLDYSFPANVEYEYKLDGYDQQWRKIKSGETPFVEYSKLPAGRYRFRVRAISSVGIPGANAIDIKIVVKPAWWFSWWALCLYLLIILTIMYTILHLLRRRKIVAEKLRLANLDKEKIEELNQLKLRFFTNISHDLKTPLSLIISPTESLMEQEPDPAKMSRLKLIHENAHRLLTLVNQIMDFRKIENKKLTLHQQSANIVDVLRRVSSLFSEFAEKKDVSLLFESSTPSLVMDFDPDKIEKVFVNLISNAIQYTPPEGSVIVNLQKVDNHKLEIMIADNGSGIDQHDLKHIFERFYQSASNTNPSGSGIGLSIVKEFVELHGGKITVDSKVGVGTTFFVMLPIINEVESAPESDPAQPIAAEGAKKESIDPKEWKLLIIEDNEQMLRYLCEELELTYAVTGVVSAEEALKKVQKEIPDVIISDVMLPGMSGVDLCRQIKENYATSHIPVILLTAKTAEEHQIEGFSAGADAYIFKPFSLKVLLSRIDNILSQRKKYREALALSTVSLAHIDVESPDKVFMDKVVSIIEKNIDNPDLNLQDICRELAVSHISFYRKIKSITGFNISGFIREIRLKKAAQLLQLKNMSVSEVLYSVGFNHKSYFTICFKERFGMTPREYAKKYGNQYGSSSESQNPS